MAQKTLEGAPSKSVHREYEVNGSLGTKLCQWSAFIDTPHESYLTASHLISAVD
jgi:hypothetical protein